MLTKTLSSWRLYIPILKVTMDAHIVLTGGIY